jgi:hypothetical protein
MANSAGLSGRAATFNGNVDVELVRELRQLKRLANDHLRSLATKDCDDPYRKKMYHS